MYIWHKSRVGVFSRELFGVFSTHVKPELRLLTITVLKSLACLLVSFTNFSIFSSKIGNQNFRNRVFSGNGEKLGRKSGPRRRNLRIWKF